MERRRSFPDVLAGGVFVLIGGAFVVGALSYELGTPLRMGPGYFPLLVGVILAALGLLIVGKGLVAGEVVSFGAVPWRAVGVIVVAVVFFGYTVRRLGFVPTSAVTALLVTLASRQVRIGTALAVAVGLTVLSTLIFVVGLQLRIPLWGPWLSF
ncbi:MULTISPECIES: tripartite tricarboxylate transporter TctB family protein [unclassified Micromonospora]|uniref:tripartite tricarboxylate transporter TctB family protein n=1 Tax=unclassified Micromonospora TaxID=2617518 RepID=UPI001B35B608|nr:MULTISPECIES: tripartite tricarboxylate transporter TctB family protein [unclassified Micromonospora]MBQ1047070.1 tripartite tricarboxylate transporter TctB family protein [Micromonospora sp. C51]WFE48383.1 tripartite tricarboxylate transporter TctB family protein [Verrucosispora sp. WMMD1129]